MIATTIAILAFVLVSLSAGSKNRCDSLYSVADLKLNACYRFESVNFPGQYMRHRGYRLYKERGSGSLYYKDSTFRVVRAINGDRRYRSLESRNYPGHYIRHSGYLGYISRCHSHHRVCKNDASWKVEYGLASRRGQRALSLRSANYPGYFLRHQNSRVKISPHVHTTLYRLDSSWIARRVSC